MMLITLEMPHHSLWKGSIMRGYELENDVHRWIIYDKHCNIQFVKNLNFDMMTLT